MWIDLKYGYGFWFQDGTFSSIIDKAAKWNLDFAEIALDYPWPDKLSSDEVSATKKKLNDLDVDVAFHGPLGGILLYHPRKEMVEAGMQIHEKCLRFVEVFNPLYYTFHIKTHPLELRAEGNKKTASLNCFEALNRLTKVAEETSINLVVENSTESGYLVQTERLLSQKIDLNLDVGHWFAGGYTYEELEDLIMRTKERISLLHIHDVRFGRGLTEDHLPLGQGNIDFVRVFNILRNGKLKWINLEMHPLDHNQVKANLSKVKKLIVS